jgi:outer membrane cobalamin receptor
MLTARLDLGWQHRGTSLTIGIGDGVTPPVMADLFFREGNGVRVNPDLLPERVAWQVDLGARQETRVFGARTALSLRGYAGRIEDMILWGLSPAYGFVWTPRNLDVNLRGGEAGLRIGPVHGLSLGGSASLSHVTTDAPDKPQVLYRPEGTAAADVLWQPGPWSFDARWHFVGIRYPNSAGINPLPSFSIFDAGAERSFGRMLRLRADVSDLADTRAEFISGFPSPGRSVSVTLTVEMP